MKKLLAGLIGALALAGSFGVAHAEDVTVVSSCGSVTLATGYAAAPLTQDTTGRLCSASTATITPSGTQDVNITQTGGATVAKGAGTAATALRVELPTDGTGKVGLNAGSAVIGHVIADSGSTTAVTALPSIPAGSALIGKTGIDQTTPGTTNGVAVDSVVDNVQITGSVSSAATLTTFNALGYGSIVYQLPSVGSGNTVVVEASSDGVAGTGTTFASVNTAVLSSTVTPIATSLSPSATATYCSPVGGATMRFRVSTYGSGTVTLNGTLKRGPCPVATLTQVSLTPTSNSANALVPTVSTTLESCHVMKASAGNLYSMAVTIQATTGIVQLFNATSAPADGAVTPIWSMPVTSNGTLGGASWEWSIPMRFSTGITACFSSATTPFTKTASATAMLTANVQ